MRRLGPILAALAVAGCATVRDPFRCPARGGPPWKDAASAHFVLRTDLPEAQAAALLRQLERLRSAVLSALFDEPPAVRAGVEVVAFASDATYRAFAPPHVDAYYLRSGGGPPRIVVGGRLGQRQSAMLAHELAHHYLAGTFQRQPRWLAEGLATHVESIGEEASGDRVTVGLPPEGRLQRARRHLVSTRELLRWDGSPGPRPALDYYAASWLLVHFLAYREPAGFADLQRRLADGSDPLEAWTAAFPAWDPGSPTGLAGLDGLLVAYARAEVETRYRQVRPAWTGEPVVRPISSPEVHAIRLALWPIGPDKGTAALRAEVAEALGEDPDHPFALQQLARLDGLDPVPLARRAVARHAEDPRAWTFLGASLTGPDQAAAREAAYRRAAELAPENAAAQHNLAVELLSAGRSGEALPMARRAAGLAPWSPPILDGYAAILSDLGQCRAAIAVQRRALDVLPERSGEGARRALRARLERYLAQCRGEGG
jgi:tetratricopeptide (TPR) repeat protein